MFFELMTKRTLMIVGLLCSLQVSFIGAMGDKDFTINMGDAGKFEQKGYFATLTVDGYTVEISPGLASFLGRVEDRIAAKDDEVAKVKRNRLLLGGAAGLALGAVAVRPVETFGIAKAIFGGGASLLGKCKLSSDEATREKQRDHLKGGAAVFVAMLVSYAVIHPTETKDLVVGVYKGCRDVCVGAKDLWNTLFPKKATPEEAPGGQMRPVLLKPAVIEIPKQAPVAAPVREARAYGGSETRGSCVEEGLREGSGGSETL